MIVSCSSSSFSAIFLPFVIGGKNKTGLFIFMPYFENYKVVQPMSSTVLVLLPGRSTLEADNFIYTKNTAWSLKQMYQNNDVNTDKETGRQPRAKKSQ